MEKMTTTPVTGHYAVAALQVCVMVPAFKPRSTGGVRLIDDGGFLIAPSGPPFID